TFQNVTTRVSVGAFDLSGLNNGKIKSITAGPFKLQSPDPNGIVEMTAASAESTDMDLAAIVHVYNPDEYGRDGTGDLVWRQALRITSYRDIDIGLPGAKVTIGDFSMEGLRVRQPRHSFAPLIDAILAHPDQLQQIMDAATAGDSIIDLLSAASVGR